MSSPSLLARHVQRLTARAIGGKQPDLVGLIQAWSSVVGAEWAARTTPVGWKPARSNQPSKLELAVLAGDALLVQHETPVLLARINAYCGAGAFGALTLKRIEEKPETKAAKPRALLSSHAPPITVEGIDDPELEAVLIRLGTALQGRTE